MIRSMTGFGQAEYTFPGSRVSIDVKSVNHRYLEAVVRLPRELQSLEEPLRKTVQRAAKRGRFDVFVAVERSGQEASHVEIDWPLVQAYAEAARLLKNKLGLSDELTLRQLIELPNAVTIRSESAGGEEAADAIIMALETALAALTSMREAEGAHLAADLSARLEAIEGFRIQTAAHAPKVVRDYAAKLQTRIRELLQSEAGVDEQRLAVEVAVMADRASIDEELTRLDSHIRKFRTLLQQSDEPVGRKLDFLIQEMNREANTIGSKSASLDITGCAIEIKAELEKMREQVQNIE